MTQLTVGKLKELLNNFPDDYEVDISGELYPEHGGNAWICVTNTKVPYGSIPSSERETYIWEEEWD